MKNEKGIYDKINAIIEIVKFKIRPNTNLICTYHKNVKELITDYNIQLLKEGNKTALEFFNMEFIVTGTYQEISIADGWGDEYIKLAENFDKLYEQLK